MTQLIPIVALVPEATFAGIKDVTLAHGDPTPATVEAMESNGWTLDSILAGSLITFALRDAGVIS